jgi:hypothetical protein
MPRFLLLVFFALALTTAHAQQDTTVPPRLAHQWQRIADLTPGTLILVQQDDNPYRIPCTLVWIDNNALACDISTYDAPPHRVIYPAPSIYSVRPAPPPHFADDSPSPAPILIGAGIGALLGGIGGSNNGDARTGAVCALLGAGLGGVMGAGLPGQLSGPPRPQYGMRTPLRASRIPFRFPHP